ncbi:MAG: restriction endonuclease subunit S, partial [Clostridiales bacterium]|nr:restriction endonuclease subunit S [Clostridiales bacterium]
MNKQKLGNFIERVERRNTEGLLGEESVRGVSNAKEIQPTKADISNRSFARFQIVENREFVFNPRIGEKLGLGYNDSLGPFIVTEDYVVFRVADEASLLPDYLNIYFRRPEFDRYARWDSWGSATEFFNWEEMCDVPIAVPPLPVQQKYADVYNAMLANQRVYERGLEDLKLTCDAYVERLRRELPHEAIGEYITLSEARNSELKYDISSVKGVSTEKRFIETIADMRGVSLKPYLLVKPDSFGYVADTSRRGDKISLAHNSSEDTYICSSSYLVFDIRDTEKLMPS